MIDNHHVSCSCVYSETLTMIAFMKNTVLGTAAYGTFEKTIEYLDECNQKSNWNSKGMTHVNSSVDDVVIGGYEDAYKRTFVSQHFLAGVLAGSAHSVLCMTMQSVEYLSQHGWNHVYKHSIPLHSLMSWSVCHTLHHGIAHALLFSTYEGTKRLLVGSSWAGGSTSTSNAVTVTKSTSNTKENTTLVYIEDHEDSNYVDELTSSSHESTLPKNVFMVGLAGDRKSTRLNSSHNVEYT
jgi:hypothetical protein